MAYFDHIQHSTDAAPRRSTGTLRTVAFALGTIVAIGVLGQVAGDWGNTVAQRLSDPQARSNEVMDWRGNSGSLPSGE